MKIRATQLDAQQTTKSRARHSTRVLERAKQRCLSENSWKATEKKTRVQTQESRILKYEVYGRILVLEHAMGSSTKSSIEEIKSVRRK